jgi:hypothetical protein
LAQIFPKWTNRIPTFVAIGTVLLVVGATAFVWYYFSPWYTDVGYAPVQPVPYSHKLHAGDLGIDCRYCHYSVEQSRHANVPPTQVCMNCHKLILPESQKLLPVRESFANNIPIKWTRVHKVGEYAYFDHSAHLRAGVGCVECHGRVDQMDVVHQVKPLSMSWCLDCHRNPDMYLRPAIEVTNMEYVPPPRVEQLKFAEDFRRARDINPPEDCSACHR